MPKRIICGVDDSERTNEAVAVAWDLSKGLGLALTLAHVIDEPEGFPFGDPTVMQQKQQQSQARGTELLRDIAMTFDLPPDTQLRTESGDPAEMLRTIAEEEDAAMLVVASRGRGRIRAALLGSVTARLVDGLRSPILVIAPGAGTKYRKTMEAHDATVVCGIDATTRIEHLMPVADRLTASLHARLLILHAGVPLMSGSPGSHAPAGMGVGIAGAPVVVHEQVDQHEHAAQAQLERARELTTETAQVDIRAELRDLAATMTRLADDPSVQALVIAQDSPWQRLATRAGCPVLVVPQEKVTGPRPPSATTVADGE